MIRQFYPAVSVECRAGIYAIGCRAIRAMKPKQTWIRSAQNLAKAVFTATAAVALFLCVASSSFASKSDKIDELVSLHDLKTSVAIGNYYLKQRALFAVRDELDSRRQGGEARARLECFQCVLAAG